LYRYFFQLTEVFHETQNEVNRSHHWKYKMYSK